MKYQSQRNRSVRHPACRRAAASSPAESSQLFAVRDHVSTQFRTAERGVALVITLIMLSVITFLTVAFLAVSSRDRVSVTTSLNQTDSHLMADTALARMQSELTTRMMARGSLLSYDPMISENYINPFGFDSTMTTNNTNNVNYDHTTTFGPLNNDDWIRNIGNLFFDPRPPVFVKTNTDNTLPLDFRFYLDYNRNRRFETNGFIPILDDFGQPIIINSVTQMSVFLGEPQWIGVLQNPNYPHSPTNRFIGRYLYLALPTSRTLDWNYIHNYSKGNVSSLPPAMNGRDGLFRNQGFGSWEINLGAFLNDLNTNMYGLGAIPPVVLYNYVADPANPNTGDAFDDALSFLRYRYNANHTHPNIPSVLRTFGINGNKFQTDLIDGHSTAPVFVPPFVNTVDPDINLVIGNAPWAGSRNPRKFFEPQELFDTTKAGNFAIRLQSLVSSNSSYNRYTFSRLLEQIGMGSEPEVRGKININYTNNPALNIVETNFVEWTPVQFFTNVASRLIRDNFFAIPDVPNNRTNYYIFNTNNPVGANFALTNIQIYPTNEYSAQLHRLLQVAANVYDATTTNQFPSAFRPQFKSTPGGTNFIIGYVEASSIDTASASATDNFLINTWTNRGPNSLNIDDNVYGIPIVIGAKKGLPNFNELVVRTSMQLSRNLQLIKTDTNSIPPNIIATNQMLSLGISNVFGVEAWNSYIRPFTNGLELRVTNQFSAVLTNENGAVVWPTNGQAFVTNFSAPPLFASSWPGALSPSSFVLPLGTNSLTFLTNAQYMAALQTFRGNIHPGTTNYESSSSVGFVLPTWTLVMTNRLMFVLIATNENRLVDFVNLDNLSTNISLGKELSQTNLATTLGTYPNILKFWLTNRLDGTTNVFIPTKGIENQVRASMGYSPSLTEAEWTGFNANVQSRLDGIRNFQAFMGESADGRMPPYTNAQTPFNPTITLDQTLSWQVNDPLVHYMEADLASPPDTTHIQFRIPPSGPSAPPPPNTNLRKINERYRPWGRKIGGEGSGPLTGGSATDGDYAYDFRVKDPRVRWSDDWDFPTNKFPSIGWLGRVHRGTPWQTIYLKAAAITNRTDFTNQRKIGDWRDWSGHIESHPTNDWHLLDVFTVAPNDNAARGLLSVNQTNQAAWSAVLSGVVVLTNSLTESQVIRAQTNAAVFQSLIIPPGPTIERIVTELNAIRATKPNGVFTSMGQVLEAPSFSVSVTNGVVDSSPYLNVTNYTFNVVAGVTNKVIDANLNKNQRFYGVTDEAYERIPRQIMSLLKLGEPRFVVYCYGQSLKPAPNSIVLSPPAGSGLFNLCTNYQITGEVVTRTGLRVEGTAQNPKTVIESYNVLPAEE